VVDRRGIRWEGKAGEGGQALWPKRLPVDFLCFVYTSRLVVVFHDLLSFITWRMCDWIPRILDSAYFEGILFGNYLENRLKCGIRVVLDRANREGLGRV
jgi:hypothetical protein